MLMDFTKEMCIQIFWTCMYNHKQEHNPERGAGTYNDFFFILHDCWTNMTNCHGQVQRFPCALYCCGKNCFVDAWIMS